MIAARLVGLYPLLPLMRGEKKESPEQALRESISAVQEVQDESLRQDLLAVMAILAGGRFSEKLVLSMIRREMVMESPIFQEWVKDAETKAKIEGKVETARAALREGLDVDMICKITGLSKETILEFKRELEN